MSYDANVIRFLRQKTVDGFDDITWLGAEQRFVAPSRNSNLNNLEEQFILGTDTYIVEYTDSESGDKITTTCYCSVPNGEIPEEQTDYYKLVVTQYAEPQEIDDELYTSLSQNENGRTLSMRYDQEGVHSIVAGGEDEEHPDSNTLYYENANDIRTLAPLGNEVNGGITNQGFKLYQKAALFFVKSEEDIIVLEKHTLRKIDISMENGNTGTITKEIIINHLQN